MTARNRLLAAAGVAGLLASAQLLGCARQPPASAHSIEWRADFAALKELLVAHHPDPFTRLPEAEFDERLRELAAAGGRSDAQLAVGLMAAVAALGDGHTTLLPTGAVNFGHWLPLSFYSFPEGLHVVSAAPEYRDLVGRRILSIGGEAAESVARATAALAGADNEFGARWNTFLLASGEVLAALGLTDSPRRIELTHETATGEAASRTIAAIEIPFSLEHRFWGEMYPHAAPGADDAIMPLGGLSIGEWRGIGDPSDPRLAAFPLHLRSRRAYWHFLREESGTLYVHVTHLTADGRGDHESFDAFHDAVFRLAEDRLVERFVLDLRFASGGDGSVVNPFVHRFIRSDHVNRRGRLFTLVGRKTFSAATMLEQALVEHTRTLLVGEPSGAPPNAYGDPETFHLPESGMTLQVSTNYWQLTSARDTRRYRKVDIPVAIRAEDYFAGVDPAMRLIEGLDLPYRSLPEILRRDGGGALRAAFAERSAQVADPGIWHPFDEREMRFAARELHASGRTRDGIEGFELLTEIYPDSYRAWRDFGIALLRDGDTERARACFRRGLEINPGYEFFREQLAEPDARGAGDAG